MRGKGINKSDEVRRVRLKKKKKTHNIDDCTEEEQIPK
jgi:hypothetical protein